MANLSLPECWKALTKRFRGKAGVCGAESICVFAPGET